MLLDSVREAHGHGVSRSQAFGSCSGKAAQAGTKRSWHSQARRLFPSSASYSSPAKWETNARWMPKRSISFSKSSVSRASSPYTPEWPRRTLASNTFQVATSPNAGSIADADNVLSFGQALERDESPSLGRSDEALIQPHLPRWLLRVNLQLRCRRAEYVDFN